MRSTYVVATVLVAIFAFALLWLATYTASSKVGEAASAATAHYHDSPGYSLYVYADMFMALLWRFLPALMLIGVLIWAVVYSQRKSG